MIGLGFWYLIECGLKWLQETKHVQRLAMGWIRKWLMGYNEKYGLAISKINGMI